MYRNEAWTICENCQEREGPGEGETPCHLFSVLVMAYRVIEVRKDKVSQVRLIERENNACLVPYVEMQ